MEDLAELRLVTPYHALSIAVRNEERAFAFWSYMSADSDDPTIRREAERLAREELGHVAKCARSVAAPFTTLEPRRPRRATRPVFPPLPSPPRMRSKR